MIINAHHNMKPACKKNKKPLSNVSARNRNAEEGNLEKETSSRNQA